ncbi:MAG: hypothetical protein Q4D51_10440 [Eubacteriales bacterium]|nr:hypothetical protein [Eubacteriales bacterium]
MGVQMKAVTMQELNHHVVVGTKSSSICDFILLNTSISVSFVFPHNYLIL